MIGGCEPTCLKMGRTICTTIVLLAVVPCTLGAFAQKFKQVLDSDTHCHAPFFHDAIHDQLSYFQDGIQKADIEAAEAALTAPVPKARIKIVLNKIYVNQLNYTSWVVEPIALVFQVLACKYKLPDLDLVLQYGDDGASMRTPHKTSPPIFSWTREERIQNDILLPFYPGQSTARRLVHQQINPENLLPWNQRKAKAVWRGSNTGGRINNPADWRKLYRGQVVLACRAIPHLCDAGFTSVTQAFANTRSEKKRLRKRMWQDMKAAGASTHPMSLLEQSRHKYIILLDGNGPSSARSVSQMLSGSTVVKQMSKKVEFFYSKLKPNVHYYPLNNPSELNATLTWLRDHDDIARQLGANMRKFALQYLNEAYLECYMLDLLDVYASLQLFKPEAPSQADGEYRWLGDIVPAQIKQELWERLSGPCLNSHFVHNNFK